MTRLILCSCRLLLRAHLEKRVPSKAEPVSLYAIDSKSNVALAGYFEWPLKVDPCRTRNVGPRTARWGICPECEAGRARGSRLLSNLPSRGVPDAHSLVPKEYGSLERRRRIVAPAS